MTATSSHDHDRVDEGTRRNTRITLALGQLRVDTEPGKNLATIRRLAEDAVTRGARMLVLPEGIIARDPDDPAFCNATAQPIDGPFVSALRSLSAETQVAIAGTVHVRSGGARSRNTHLVIDAGEIVAAYEKLHLFDAFGSLESDQVEAGDEVPPLVEIDGVRFGLMTCYDLRFPELARAHAAAGADVLLVPAAWVRGEDKVHHWRVMATARALENTVWVAAVGEISSRNVGHTMLIDPLGRVVDELDEQTDTLLCATVDTATLADARRRLPVLANRRFADPVLES